MSRLAHPVVRWSAIAVVMGALYLLWWKGLVVLIALLAVPVVPAKWEDGVRRKSWLAIGCFPWEERGRGDDHALWVRDFNVEIRWPYIVGITVRIARYGVDDFMGEHTDRPGALCFPTLQVTLQRPTRGGEFRATSVLARGSWFTVFDSRYPHEVTRVEAGDREVALVGLCIQRLPR